MPRYLPRCMGISYYAITLIVGRIEFYERKVGKYLGKM